MYLGCVVPDAMTELLDTHLPDFCPILSLMSYSFCHLVFIKIGHIVKVFLITPQNFLLYTCSYFYKEKINMADKSFLIT